MLRTVATMAVYAFMALFPLVNPVGTTPIFLSLTAGATQDELGRLTRRVPVYSFFLLLVSLLLGGVIINLFGIQIAHVEVAGGLVVFYSAWEMLSGRSGEQGAGDRSQPAGDRAFFPLTMPITAGPGCMAVAIAVGSRCVGRSVEGTLASYLGAGLGLLALSLSVWLCFRFASRLFHRLGPTGTLVVTKMSAFVLMAIGVEIFWSGLSQLILQLR